MYLVEIDYMASSSDGLTNLSRTVHVLVPGADVCRLARRVAEMDARRRLGTARVTSLRVSVIGQQLAFAFDGGRGFFPPPCGNTGVGN